MMADDYDFIIIDLCHLWVSLTINAMSAANSVLIPVQPQYYAADGLTELLKVVRTKSVLIRKLRWKVSCSRWIAPDITILNGIREPSKRRMERK